MAVVTVVVVCLECRVIDEESEVVEVVATDSAIVGGSPAGDFRRALADRRAKMAARAAVVSRFGVDVAELTFETDEATEAADCFEFRELNEDREEVERAESGAIAKGSGEDVLRRDGKSSLILADDGRLAEERRLDGDPPGLGRLSEVRLRCLLDD